MLDSQHLDSLHVREYLNFFKRQKKSYNFKYIFHHRVGTKFNENCAKS
jgi:hypothetical protein